MRAGGGPAEGGGLTDSGLRNAHGPPGPGRATSSGKATELCSPGVGLRVHLWPGVVGAAAMGTGPGGPARRSLMVNHRPRLLSLPLTPE